MGSEKPGLYSSSEAYLKGSGVMENELTMWSVAAGIFVQEVIRKLKRSLFGHIQTEIGLEVRKGLGEVSVLDMCCGPGTFVNFLSLFYPKIAVAGIDLNEAFLDYASRRFKGYGWEFIKADAKQMSLGKTFDFVTAVSAYHHIEDEGKVDFLLSAKRHLSSGGKVIICEHFLPYYADGPARLDAINRYYEFVRNYCLETEQAAAAVEAIDETQQLELSGNEERKVHHGLFDAHARAAGFSIALEIPVWQPKEFKNDDAGSYVILLEPLSS